eukprot:COSAG01_NODE_55819_length_322_cov_1.206278_1_plen_81_part_10
MHEDLGQQVDGQENAKDEKDEAEFEAEMLDVANKHEAMLQAEKQNEEAEFEAEMLPVVLYICTVLPVIALIYVRYICTVLD